MRFKHIDFFGNQVVLRLVREYHSLALLVDKSDNIINIANVNIEKPWEKLV